LSKRCIQEKKMKKFVTLATLCATAGLAQAGESYSSTGMIKGQSTAAIHAISEGHVAFELLSTQDVFEMDAEGHPFSGMSGNCTGAAEVKGGSANGGGMCFYAAENGDTAVNSWTVNAVDQTGAIHGRWIMVGGTGGMAGINGGGTYKSVTNRETGEQTITLTGAVSTP
jgi:hypothetical protein